MKIYENILEVDECEFLIDYTKKIKDNRFVKNHNRNIELFRNDDYTDLSFLNEKLESINIFNQPTFNINKYMEGYYFLPHVDRGGIYDINLERIKTLIINLSNPQDYLGGDLIVDNKKVINKQGSAVLFDSGVIHEVTEINQGIRYSMVFWIKNENLKNFQSII